MTRAGFLMLVGMMGAAAVTSAQTIQVDKNNRTIAITADDKASAEADIATIAVGFTAYGPDAASAYRNGSQVSNAIVAALKKAGVSDQAIESRAQNLTPTMFPANDKSTPDQQAQRAFTLSQSWSVHTAAADAATVLHAAVEAGANESGNIEWDLADRNGLQAKAAEKALVRARQIATQMAAGLNAHLGQLIYASNQAPSPPVVPRVYKFAAAGMAAPAPTQPLAIRPQQVEESATVYAVFAIE
jgi:uncharacterized protein